MADRKTDPPIDEPCQAEAAPEGTVAVDSPEGTQMTMTPRAALETARNLSDAAIDALMADGDGRKIGDKPAKSG